MCLKVFKYARRAASDQTSYCTDLMFDLKRINGTFAYNGPGMFHCYKRCVWWQAVSLLGISFRLGSRNMIVMNSAADSPFLNLPFSFLGDILTYLPLFNPPALSLRSRFLPPPTFLLLPPLLPPHTETVLTLYYLNLLYFLTARKQKCAGGKKAHLLCLNLLWGITLLFLLLKTRDVF